MTSNGPTGRPPRLALTGSSSVGKTTLGQALSEQLGVPFIPEAMRARLEAGLDLHKVSRDGLRDLLIELYDETMQATGAAIDAAGGVVSDRSPADFVAYWLYYGYADPISQTEEFVERARQDLARFDAVIVLPWGVLPLQEDGVRSANRWRQLHFQHLVEGMTDTLAESGTSIHRLNPDIIDIEGRLRWVLDTVAGPEAQTQW